MGQHLQPNFEAMVYSANSAVLSRCTELSTSLPITWVMVEDQRTALQHASAKRFDILVLDVDSPQTEAFLKTLSAGKNSHSVVLAVSERPIDPDILEICYKAQFFYPVRPDQIEEQLCRAMLLAERLSAQNKRESQRQPLADEPGCAEDEIASASFWRSLARKTLRVPRISYRMQHALSIVWQERAASAIASVGAIWLVHEMTKDFVYVQSLELPPEGPTYLIALAVLLWLCAKQRRVSIRLENSIVACTTES